MKRRQVTIYGVVTGTLLALLAGAFALDWIDFFEPVWLLALSVLALVPWLASRSLAGLPPRTSLWSALARALVLLLVICCLADTRIVLKNDGLTVFFLLDYSASVPEYVREEALAFVRAAAEEKPAKDQAGIVVFAENASVELPAMQHFELGPQLHSFVNQDYTDIENALRLTSAVFPQNTKKKIVLITDGNENRGLMIDGVRAAAGAGVQVDILPVTYRFSKEVRMEKVAIPERVRMHETFEVKVIVEAQQDSEGVLQMYRNHEQLLGEGRTVRLKQGSNSFTVPLKLEQAGFYVYRARISSPDDTILSNNEASGYVYIAGKAMNLYVSPSKLEVQYLMSAAAEEGLEGKHVLPSAFPRTLGELQAYDCIIMANVGAESFTEDQMRQVRAAVRDQGVGLIMVGGVNSFGAGDYFGTPIEEALPVSMDIRQKKVNPKGALVLVLHTCEFPRGNYWAKEITKQSIDTLNPHDEAGVIVYGAGEQWLFPLSEVGDGNSMKAKVSQASPGDMPSFVPAFSMALKSLANTDAMVRHIIVISDGDPAKPQPQDVQAMADAGITVTCVAINPHSPRDRNVMKYISDATGGSFYFVEDPSTLPQIFVKEAKIVRRSAIFNDPFYPQMVQTSEITKGLRPGEFPPLMAYVVTTAKDRATVPLVSDNENQDPVLASWRYGLGKAVAFTSDATSNWGTEWVSWPKYKKVWGQIIRWASRERETTGLNVRTQVVGDRGRLIIDAVSPGGSYQNFLEFQGRVTDPDYEGRPLEVRQTAPGRYEADFPAGKMGVNLLSLAYLDPTTGAQKSLSAGVAVPYSPEYRQLETNRALLERAAELAGGKVLDRAVVDGIFESTQPPSRSFQPIWPALAIAALLLFLLDVTLRRVILTREDLATAWSTVRERVVFWRPTATETVERSETMSALLTRKQRVFSKRQEQASPGPDFKSQLDQAAKQGQGREGSARAEAERQLREPAPRDRPASRPAADEPAEPARDKSPPADKLGQGGSGYTGRLLDAKRRARKQRGPESPKDGDDSPREG